MCNVHVVSVISCLVFFGRSPNSAVSKAYTFPQYPRTRLSPVFVRSFSPLPPLCSAFSSCCCCCYVCVVCLRFFGCTVFFSVLEYRYFCYRRRAMRIDRRINARARIFKVVATMKCVDKYYVYMFAPMSGAFRYHFVYKIQRSTDWVSKTGKKGTHTLCVCCVTA